jgi:hypothetical protein
MNDDLEYLRTAIHDLNNRIGVILATSELLLMDAAEGKPRSRCQMIEQKAMEAREILLGVAHRYFE